MQRLDVKKPIFEEEELVKAVTKEIYYKRTEKIKTILEENRNKANLVGFINPAKQNSCTHPVDVVLHLCCLLDSFPLVEFFLDTVYILL